jgi:hypothetical protein
VPLAGVYANGTLVVLLSGVRRGPTRRSAIAIPISFEPKQERICLALRAQHSAPVRHKTDSPWRTWGSAPGFVEPQNNVGAESAIHFCLGLRNHLLN